MSLCTLALVLYAILKLYSLHMLLNYVRVYVVLVSQFGSLMSKIFSTGNNSSAADVPYIISEERHDYTGEE